MRHGSLFSGIGGFDLAAEWMGWENMFQCERDPFCQKILCKHFPGTDLYDDIHGFNAKKYEGTIDIISGGFPCQPFSVAGKRKGSKDELYLWPQMLRIIREVRPKWIVGENVAGLLHMEDGSLLEGICTSLEDEGYTVEPPYIIPACATGAWHRRDRIWIIARTNIGRDTGGQGQDKKADSIQELDRGTVYPWMPIGAGTDDPHDGGERGQGEQQEEVPPLKGVQRGQDGRIYADWGKRPDLFTPVLCRSDDGVPDRVDRTKALGNAVVPQLVYHLFRAVQIADRDHKANKGTGKW